jgi:YD repeat-containing protein
MKLVVVVTFLLAVNFSSGVAGPIYDRHGNYVGTAVRNSDGSVSVPNGVRWINGRTYDANGRFTSYSVRRGNVLRHYDPSGRLTGVSVKKGSKAIMYDARGGFTGTVDLRN